MGSGVAQQIHNKHFPFVPCRAMFQKAPTGKGSALLPT